VWGTGGAQAATVTLTVVVAGAGRVASNPAGIDCSGDACYASFAAGTVVTLGAFEAGGVLTGWSDACTGTAGCSVRLDADTQVTATFAPIPVGAQAHGVAVTPDGKSALVTLAQSAGLVRVVSLVDYTLGDAINVGAFPGAIAVTPDGNTAAVNNQNSVTLIDLANHATVSVPSPCVGDTLYDIAVTPDSQYAVTTMFNSSCVTNTLALISLASGSIYGTYNMTASITEGIAVVPDGSSALVSLGILGTTVKRVPLSAGSAGTISSTSSSFGIAVTPNGAEALIASGDGDTIKRVSLATNTVTGSIDYASNQDPHNIAVTSDGALAVVVGSFDVGVVSLATGAVAQTFPGGGRSVAVTPDGARALVTSGSTLRVYLLPP
jgi:DNA-binding beta-propeller fold protein YncE